MNFAFSNLLGAPYRGGTLLIHDNELLTPVGNRVTQVGAGLGRRSAARPPVHARRPLAPPHSSHTQIDLTQSTSSTLPFEAGRALRTLAVSPDGRLLLAVDESGRALVVNRRRRALLHRITFKDAVRAAAFSPDGAYLACAVGRLVQASRRGRRACAGGARGARRWLPASESERPCDLVTRPRPLLLGRYGARRGCSAALPRWSCTARTASATRT